MRRIGLVILMLLISADPGVAAAWRAPLTPPGQRFSLRQFIKSARDFLKRAPIGADDEHHRRAASAQAAAAPVAALANPALGGLQAAQTAPASVFDASAPANGPSPTVFIWEPPAARRPPQEWNTQAQLARLKAKPRAVEESFKVVIVGDAEPGRFYMSRKFYRTRNLFRRQLESAQRQSVDAIIQLGDMVSRGTKEQFRSFLALLDRVGLQIPYLTVIGNHDRRSPHRVSDAVEYTSSFGESNYFFDRGAARFVVLDTSAARLMPDQLRWFDEALATDKRKIVLTHMPPYLPNGPLKDWTDYKGLPAVGGFRRGSVEFYEIVARRGVERVYLGHVHGFGVKEYKGVRFILSGGGGSPMFPSGVPKKDRFHHFIVATIDAKGISEVVHKLDGTSFPL